MMMSEQFVQEHSSFSKYGLIFFVLGTEGMTVSKISMVASSMGIYSSEEEKN